MSIQKICAGFETTLSAKILAAGMSFGLSTHVNKTGAELNGEYGFIWDEGTSTEEWGYGTILNGVVAVIKRGLDPEDPEIEVPALKFDHSRGSSLKITDYPFLGFVKKYLGGEKGLPSPLKYATHQVPVADEELVDKKFVQDSMSGSIGSANPITAGTIRTTHNQGTNTRAMSTLVRAQDTPNMTLLVGAYKHSEIDKNISFAGGNSPAFIDPDLAGDLIIGTNPSNAETFVITLNGTVCTFTFVSTIGATPGNVLIGASATATRANLAALINTPGTSTANGVAFTGAQLTALGLINATDDLSSSIFIKSISTTLTTFTASETMAAGGNTWTINTTKKRIDLLVLQISDSTLQIRRGIEAVTPVAPTPTSGDIVLAQVYLLPGLSHIDDVSDGTNGYILAWYFPQIYRTDFLLPKFFGNGSDGDVVISVDTVLSADKYYNNLTINSGVKLTTTGYKVYVKGTLTNNGIISADGADGSVGGNPVNGGNSSGGLGGVATNGTIYGGTPGSNGGGGNNSSDGSGGGAGAAKNCICKTGKGGGAGGNGWGKSGAAGGGGGVATAETITFQKAIKGFVAGDTSLSELIIALGSSSSTLLSSAAGAGGGGGGGGTQINPYWSGAGGGGGGASGGVLFLVANIIINYGTIRANGGAGGVGGIGNTNDYCGSGGGGAGGNGGLVMILFNTFTTQGTIQVNGGARGEAGAGKTAAGGQTSGLPGTAGDTGTIIKIQL